MITPVVPLPDVNRVYKGSYNARQNQARFERRYGAFLHDHQEQAHHAGKDADQEIRPSRAQARDL
jgi:hypothetical protein